MLNQKMEKMIKTKRTILILVIIISSLFIAQTVAAKQYFNNNSRQSRIFEENNDGEIMWSSTFGSGGSDYGYSIEQTNDGGFILTGFTNSYGEGMNDVYVVKIDSEGDTIWTRTFGGSFNDYGYSVKQTSDGGYIVTGTTESFGAGFTDVYLIKTDELGDTIWTRTYGGSSYDMGYSVIQTNDGGYLVTGETSSYGIGHKSVILIKIDSYGNRVWIRTYGGSNSDQGYSVQQTRDGGYIIAGYTNSYGAGLNDVYLVKSDADGDTIWTKTYGGSDDDYSYSVKQTYDDGYIIAGYTSSFSAREADIYLIKTDSGGNTIWARTFGGNNYDFGRSVEQTIDEGYIVAGAYDWNFEEDKGNIYVVKTNSLGDTMWTRTYGGSSCDYSMSIAKTNDNGYIVAGGTSSDDGDVTGNQGIMDCWVVRISPDDTTSEQDTTITQDTISSDPTIQPVVFTPNGDGKNDVVEIVGLDESDQSEMDIYDITGAKILKLRTTEWDGTNNGKKLIAGVYLYVLKVNDEVVDNGTITLVR